MAVCSKVIGAEVLCAQHATFNASIGRIGAVGNIAASKRHLISEFNGNRVWEDGKIVVTQKGWAWGKMRKYVNET